MAKRLHTSLNVNVPVVCAWKHEKEVWAKEIDYKCNGEIGMIFSITELSISFSSHFRGCCLISGNRIICNSHSLFLKELVLLAFSLWMVDGEIIWLQRYVSASICFLCDWVLLFSLPSHMVEECSQCTVSSAQWKACLTRQREDRIWNSWKKS
jgi:hypothetical protein